MLSPDSQDLHTANYDYQLPASAIAQNPVEPRDHSRLLVFGQDNLEHRYFYELSALLEPGDLLVLPVHALDARERAIQIVQNWT